MILELILKTPDLLSQFDSVECSSTQEEAIKIASRYIKYGEIVTLLVDTVEETVTVKKLK